MTRPHHTAHRPAPLAGLKRVLARLPIHLYRIGLGPLFGGRFLLVIPTGRSSGLTRRVVVEVVERDPETRTWTVAVGLGSATEWYELLHQTPQATVQYGRRYYPVTAEFLSPEEARHLMARYRGAHPRRGRRLCAWPASEVGGGREEQRPADSRTPFVRLRAAKGC